MALRGDIAEASLDSVVRELARERRTGCLSAVRDGEFGSIWFVDGRVVHATVANRRDRLGEALVRAGALDDADLRAALVEQLGDPDTRLGALLGRRGSVDPAALDAMLEARAAEAVYELLAWTRGSFGFESEVRPDGRDVVAGPLSHAPGLDAAGLLDEAVRRADERALIATEVPGPDAVFAAVAPARADADEEPLGADERRVLPLLDARRDLRTLADDAGLSEFHAARALHQLVRRGRARRVVRPADGAATRADAARAEEHRSLGIAFARAGMMESAARELRRVLELRPADAHARLHLGLVALRSGRWGDAAAVLGEAAALPSPGGAVFHALGIARHRLGQLAAADDAFDEAARRGLAGDPRLGTARGSLTLARGDADGARRHLAEARAAWSARGAAVPAAWFHAAALAALGAADVTGAETVLDEGLAAYPEAAPLLVVAAALAAELGRAAAADLAARAVAADPASAHAQRLLGDVYHDMGRLADAAAAYRTAVRLDATLGPEVWARLGALAMRDAARGEATGGGERACKLQPARPTGRADLDARRRAAAPTRRLGDAAVTPAPHPDPAVPDALPATLPEDDDADGFAALLAQVEREHGFRVGSYKQRCLRRRVAVRMRATGAHTYAEYAGALAADAQEYERLLDVLTINVTRVFRDWEAWAALDALVLGPLVDAGRPVRGWSAGCASGEEAYSLAALLHARAARTADPDAALARIGVLGTDVDRASLVAAAAGAYGPSAFDDAPPELSTRYFPPGAAQATPRGVAVAHAAPELRALTTFVRHDLLREPAPDGPWDLIACRNVVIYFDRESQEALFERFHAALAPGGVLFLGRIETLLGRIRTLFVPLDARRRIFRRA
jgi:chemotaxis methyl-accepting protein methylase/Tfp pilus assembly protein PilF